MQNMDPLFKAALILPSDQGLSDIIAGVPTFWTRLKKCAAGWGILAISGWKSPLFLMVLIKSPQELEEENWCAVVWINSSNRLGLYWWWWNSLGTNGSALVDRLEGAVGSATSGAENSATAIGAIVTTVGLEAGMNGGTGVEIGGSATGYT